MLNAQETIVEIGEDQNPSASFKYYLPVYEYAKYSISQQIYLENEFEGNTGNITGISFKLGNNRSEMTRQWEVYLKKIGNSTITTSFESLSDATKVYDGDVYMSGKKDDWVNIHFSTSFMYEGGNVLVCVYDKSGNALTSTYHTFYEYSAPNRSVYKSNSTEFDLAKLPTGTVRHYTNQIRFAIQPTGPVLAKPTEVNASPTNLYPGESTTISWTAAEGATAYNVYVGNEKVAEGVTSPYTLEGLTYNVDPGHNITVTAIHSEGESAKSDAVNVKMTAKSNVTITVKNPAGTAIQGATVRLYDGQDQYGKAIEEQTFTTDVNGQVVTNLLYLKNYYNYRMEVSKSPYITDNGQYISHSLLNNPTYTKEITLQLPIPTNVGASPTSLYPGESTTITWNDADGATSYNVYVGDTKVASEVTSPYILSGLTYNVNPGHNITVKAVHAEGESANSNAVVVKVAGTFPLVVNVKDESGNPVVGATVSITTADRDELYNAIPDYELTTDSEGEINQTLPLLYSSWGACYTITVTKVDHATVYNYIYYNYISNDTEYILDCVLKMEAPLTPYVDKDKIYEGENVVVTWAKVSLDTRAFIGYNVYNGDTKLNTEPLSENTYTIEGLEYNMEGHPIYVSAVYDGGESAKSANPAKVYVTGKSVITISVKDELDNDITQGASVEIIGKDEFGNEREYSLPEAGSYTKSILAGTYTAIVTRYDYKDEESELVVIYGADNITAEIVMEAKPESVFTVTADGTGVSAKVNWNASSTKYNVYRKDVITGVVEKIASDIEATTYTDNNWANILNGRYQYGVSTYVVGGETEQITVLSENFDNVANYSIPEGWSVIRGTNSWYWYAMNGVAYSNYHNGDYTTYLVTPLVNIQNATLQFRYKSVKWQDNSRNDLNIRYSTSPTGPWSESLYYRYYSENGAYENIEVSLTDIDDSQVYIAFCNTNVGGGGYATYIDDIIIVDEIASLEESKINWSNEIEKSFVEFTGAEDNDWHNANNWSGVVQEATNVKISASALISSDVTVNNIFIGETADVTIKSGAKLTVTNSIYNTSSVRFIIKDGAQVVHNSTDDVYARFDMNVIPPSEWSDEDNKDGWQLVASPTKTNIINLTGYGQTPYDLYKYDGQNELWLNRKDNNDFASEEYLESGVGYLFSYQKEVTRNLSGVLNNATSHTYTVSYTEGKPLANFHLLGNPFSFDMDLNNVSFDNVYEAFATVDPTTGGYIKHTKEQNKIISVGDGFFVEATGGDKPSISYNAGSKSRGEKYEYLNVIASGKQGSNNVIIKLSGKEERGFSKLENLNQSIADLYVKNNGRQYSVLGYDKDVKEVELFFDAKEMGNYTIGIEPNGKFQSVTLVDRMTGAETNMLLDSYTFTATANDNPNRFLIRLANGEEPTANSQFVYQSGEELIINAEGTIQIIDVMGRMVYSNDVESSNNRINVSNLKGATYIVRNISNNTVRTQKIVIL